MSSTNPFTDGSKQSWEIFRMVYEPLTQPTKDGGVEGELAISWENPSPTTYVFRLRPGVKFSNGRAFDSSDVVTTFEEYKKAGTFWARIPVQSVTAVDPLTVRFELTRAFGAFPAALQTYWMLPGKELRDGTFNLAKDFLGTGPFMVKDHLQDVSWTFVKNPNYWRQGYPKVDQVDVKIIKEDSARLAALKSGTIDFAIFDSNDTQKLLQGAANTKVVIQGTTDFYFIAFNPTWSGSKFVDPRVRKAMVLALNRQRIIDTALGGVGVPTADPPVTFADGCDPAAMNGGKMDVAQAQALLKQAGVENLSFEITVVPGFGAVLAPQMAQVIQQDLAQIGVKVTITTLETGAWIDRTFTKGEFDATLNWATGGPDASLILNVLDPAKTPAFSKWMLNDPQLNQMINEAQAATPGAARTATLRQICQRVLDNGVYIPIATKPTVIAYRTDRVNPVLLQTEPVQQTFRKMDEFTRVAN
jgi:peptide/nickel transport system substrate-binding protein